MRRGKRILVDKRNYINWEKCPILNRKREKRAEKAKLGENGRYEGNIER